MKHNSKWMLLVFTGYLLTLGLEISMFIIFTFAYLNGYKALVVLDMFGEQHIEWFLVCIVMCLSILGLYGLGKIMKEELKA